MYITVSMVSIAHTQTQSIIWDKYIPSQFGTTFDHVPSSWHVSKSFPFRWYPFSQENQQPVVYELPLQSDGFVLPWRGVGKLGHVVAKNN